MRLGTLARTGLLLLACAVVLALARPARAAAPTATERALLAAVNDTRVAFGLHRLRLGERLQESAQGYARRLLQRGLFAHGSLAPGVGETLAWGTDATMDVRTIVRLWLESPAHRRILLWPAARWAGFGVTMGWFRGNPSIRLAVGRFSR